MPSSQAIYYFIEKINKKIAYFRVWVYNSLKYRIRSYKL